MGSVDALHRTTERAEGCLPAITLGHGGDAGLEVAAQKTKTDGLIFEIIPATQTGGN